MEAFVDMEGYPSGNEQQPDFAIVKKDNLLLEFTVNFETNIKKNFGNKNKLYQQLLADL